MGLWPSPAHAQVELLLTPAATHAPSVPWSQGRAPNLRKVEMHAALAHDWMAAYQQEPLDSSPGGQLTPACMQDQLLML